MDDDTWGKIGLGIGYAIGFGGGGAATVNGYYNALVRRRQMVARTTPIRNRINEMVQSKNISAEDVGSLVKDLKTTVTRETNFLTVEGIFEDGAAWDYLNSAVQVASLDRTPKQQELVTTAVQDAGKYLDKFVASGRVMYAGVGTIEGLIGGILLVFAGKSAIKRSVAHYKEHISRAKYEESLRKSGSEEKK